MRSLFQKLIMMKKNILLLVMGLLLFSCGPQDNPNPVIPSVSTGEVSNITSTTATCAGNVTSEGVSSVTARGVCWSTSQNPMISNSKTTNGSGLGAFLGNITGMSPNTTYYVRAYATNSEGTTYGEQKTFTTNAQQAIPSVTTGNVTNITSTTATCAGNVTSEGVSSVTSRGVCWSTSQNPTIADSKTTAGTGVGAYTSNITDLSPNTTYYVRAYATNSEGTAYGEQKTFNTPYETFIDSRDYKEYKIVTIGSQVWMAENLAYLPSVVGPSTTSDIEPLYYVYDYNGTDIDAAKATENYQTYGVLYNWPAVMNGALTSNTIPSGVQGVCPAGWHLPSDTEWKELEMYLGMTQEEADEFTTRGTDEGSKLKEAGTTHWRYPNAGATNSSGFTVLPGGQLYSYDGNFVGVSTTCMFWTSTQWEDDSAVLRILAVAEPTVMRSGQEKGRGYSVRCIMDYQKEPGSSPDYGIFTDQRDLKVYKTITIGGKEWMAENLAYLPSVNQPSSWSYDLPHYYVYNYYGTNVEEAKATYEYKNYGVLYNWPAAMNSASSSDAKPSGIQGACPAGWHLPSDAEWKDLEMYLGMTQTEADKEGYRGTDEGGKFKHPWEEYWSNPNRGATNSSGFTALPGGYMFGDPSMYFWVQNFGGMWWTSTQEDEGEAWSRILSYLVSTVSRESERKMWGYSVRCLRN